MKRKSKGLIALILALLCLLMAGCGSEPAAAEHTKKPSRDVEDVDDTDDVKKTPAPVEEPDEPDEPEDDFDISPYVGCWKYDEVPFYFVIGEEYEWMAINAYGDTVGPLSCGGAEDGLALYDENGDVYTTFSKPVKGRTMDAEGETLTEMEYIMLLPTPEDALTETIAFPGDFSNISVMYPVTMNAKAHPRLSAGLSFNAEMENGTDDYFSNISVSFQPATGFDPYLTQGKATAEKYLRTMLDQLVSSMYGDYLLKSMGSDVQDYGSYYEIVGYLWLDGSIFVDADAGMPVRATMSVRYYGPCGYVLVTQAVALENRIENYYMIADNIADSCDIDLGWSTAPKALPANAESQKTQAAGSDAGDDTTPFYWTDADGDVWYWNGYWDEFIGFGDSYYIDDDGQYYESNDAGWDDWDYEYDWDYDEDDYDFWSDPGDYYYDDGWGDYFDDDWDF